MPRKKKCSLPCNTCPWKKSNHGKEHPNGWYHKDNLKDLWNGIRNGEPMICHSTDAKQKEYGGTKDIAPGNERHCIGALILVQRHLNAITECTEKGYGGLSEYHFVTRKPITRKGITAWAERINFPYPGEIPLPTLLAEGDDLIRLPFLDRIGAGMTLKEAVKDKLNPKRKGK